MLDITLYMVPCKTKTVYVKKKKVRKKLLWFYKKK